MRPGAIPRALPIVRGATCTSASSARPDGTRSDDDWIALTFYGDLENPFERRRRDGTVLGIAKHVEARIRVYKGAFAYFAGDDIPNGSI